MTEIILHIGLPKTGTTTMQYQIFSSEDNRAYYLGKYANGENRFHKLVSEYLSGRLSLESAKSLIRPFLPEIGTRLYSNEMITVCSPISYKEKLSKLAQLFEGHTVHVLATTRKPSKLAPSVFAELHPTREWRNFAQFLHDEQSDWLDPLRLHKAIVDSSLADRGNVVFLDFDMLIENRFRPLGEVLPWLIIAQDIKILNARQRFDNLMLSRPINLYDALYRVALSAGLFRIIPPRLRGVAGKAIGTIPFSWQKVLEVPGDELELKLLDQAYSEALQTLSAYSYANWPLVKVAVANSKRDGMACFI